jgi:two-component system sensor kinase FixL
VIEAHGGRIWIERPPDGGTRVAFTIPALVADEEDSLE